MSQDVRTLRDFAGNRFGEQIYRNAKEGQIMEVAYVWPMPGSTRYVLKSAYVARAGDQVCGSASTVEASSCLPSISRRLLSAPGNPGW